MTRNEATERAESLWGDGWKGQGPRTLTLHPSHTERGCWHIDERRDADHFLVDRHFLTSDGHTDCHEKCLQREAYLATRVGGNG